MVVTLVHVWVKESYIDNFIAATVENRNHSVMEAGNMRFDILRDAEDPLKFVFYEAYETEQDVSAHKTTAHYLKWRDTVGDWMEKERKGFKHWVVEPVNRSQW